MASRDVLLLNMVMLIVISLYAFGGERPVVSLSTAVAGGFLQLYFFVANTLVSRVVQPPQKKMEEDCADDQRSSSVSQMLRNGASCMVAYLAALAPSQNFQGLGCMITVPVLVAARVLRLSGALTTVSQAIPLAFVLGLLLRFAMSMKDAVVEGVCGEIPLTSAEDSPYNVEFWSELGPAVTDADPIDTVSHDADILADIYLSIMSW